MYENRIVVEFYTCTYCNKRYYVFDNEDYFRDRIFIDIENSVKAFNTFCDFMNNKKYFVHSLVNVRELVNKCIEQKTREIESYIKF